MRMRIEEGGEMLRLIDEVVVYRLMMMMMEGGLSRAELT